MKRFLTGDMVEWTSQSQAYRKKKAGKVVGVVPAGFHIDRMEALWSAGWDKPKNPGMSRDHETYLIAVGARRRLYWPRVVHLSAAGGSKEEST